MRQTFVEWAEKTVHRSFWAGAYYRQQRNRGATHYTAVRALAFKWIRILYRCWKSRTPYNESLYLKALQRLSAISAEFVAGYVVSQGVAQTEVDAWAEELPKLGANGEYFFSANEYMFTAHKPN